MQTYQNWKANEQLLTEAVELLEAVRANTGELEQILTLAKDGDPSANEAWPDFVKSFLGGYLNKFGFQAGLNHQEKEDVLQNVLMQITRHIDQMNPDKNIKGWLVMILRNAIIDKQRKMIRHKKTRDFDAETEPASSELDPHDSASRMEVTEQVRNAIASLEPIHQQVLIMYYQNGMKYGEIAQSLLIPEGTVKSRMAAAKNRLREKIEAL